MGTLILTPAQEALCDLFDALRRRGIVSADLLDDVNIPLVKLCREHFGKLRPPPRGTRTPASMSPTPAEIERWKCGELGLGGVDEEPALDDCPKCLAEEV